MEDFRTFYQEGIELLSREGERTVYKLRGDDGDGQVIDYALYPGVSMQFNDIRCRHIGAESMSLPLLEMNYCSEGRFECELTPGGCVRLREGDFAACRVCRKASSCFPTGSYRGVSLMLDTEAAQSYMDGHHPELKLRLRDLPQRLCPGNTCFLAQASGLLQRSFEQLSDAPPCLGIGYYRAKALELLALLSAWTPGRAPCQSYLKQGRAELMRHIRSHLEQELGKALTLDELAKEHGLCATALKRDFSAMYGLSPAACRRRCRMDQAARELRETDLPIMQIAVDVGYLNASKFSAAFRAERGLTPAAFRKKSRAERSISGRA